MNQEIDCENQLILKKEKFADSYCCGMRKVYNIDDFDTIYNLIIGLNDLTDNDKNIILTRFKRISRFVDTNYVSIYRYYNFSKIFIITAGIVTPALMSINGTVENNKTGFNSLLFIFIWLLQLFISIINSYINFYKWDKKYFLYMAYKSKIEQEIWLYLELSSRYGTLNKKNQLEKNSGKVSHGTKLKLFLNRIEYLYKKLKESDYEIEITDEDKHEKHDNNKNMDKDFSPSFFKNVSGIYTTPTPEQIEFNKSKNVKFNNQIEMKIIKNNDDKKKFLNFINNLEILYKLRKELSNMKNDDENSTNISNKIEQYVNEIKDISDQVLRFKVNNLVGFNENLNNYWTLYLSKKNSQKDIEEYKKLICDNLEIENIPIDHSSL